MSSTDHPEAEPTPSVVPDSREQVAGTDTGTGTGTGIDCDTVTIHRSPRYYRFMIAGGVLGVIVALVLTFAFPEPPGFNVAQIFGFLGILFVIAGIVVGSVVALIIDRASRRRATTLQVERIESTGDDAP